MFRSLLPRRLGLLGLLPLLLLIASCGGEAGVTVEQPGGMGPPVTGQVQLPNGQLAYEPSTLRWLAAAVISRAQALVAENIKPVGRNVIVRLILLDEEDVVGGKIRANVHLDKEVFHNSTNDYGQYEVRMRADTDARTCRYMVQVGSAEDGTLTRAFVYRTDGPVDINFQSEAVVRLILEEIRDGDATLCDFEAGEISNIYETVVASGGLVSGNTVAEVNAAGTTAARLDPAVMSAIAAAAGGQGTPPPTNTVRPTEEPTEITPTETAPQPTRTDTKTTVPRTPTRTHTGIPTATAQATLTFTPRPSTSTPTRTHTGSPTATAQATLTFTPPPTSTSTATRTSTAVPTSTSSATRTNTPDPTSTGTATRTNTPVSTSTGTATRTNTPVSTSTSPATATSTSTPVSTNTDTASPVPSTPTSTPTQPTSTVTLTPTDTPVPPTATPTIPPTDTPVPTATQFVIGEHKCVFDNSGPAPGASTVQITTQALPLPPYTAVGAIDISCGAVAPETGKASCDCSLQSFNPIEIIGIGFICFTPGAPCPAGEIDCDGGNGLDVTMDSDHNIGACTGNPDCAAQCAAYCDPIFAFNSGCEGFCVGGANDNLPCTDDSDCPDGSCPGKDGNPHGNICGCDCLGIGGNPSVAGGLQCNLSVNINVEIAGPCGDGDILIAVGTRCLPLTTEAITSQIHDANKTAGKKMPAGSPYTATGTAGDCAGLATSVTTGLGMEGALNFFDSTIGDLTTFESFVCQ